MIGVGLGSIPASLGDEPSQRRNAPLPSLRETYRGRFDVGVGIGVPPGGRSQAALKLLLSQFSGVTPENCMKMDRIQRVEGRFDFGEPDALVAFAAANRLKVHGHTLVWAKDERTPRWLFRDGEKPASRELVLRRMKTHIETVVGRYRGKVASWDVVNEALADEAAFIRPSNWLDQGGEEFIALAFVYAHAADPDAVLIYNDYNIELPKKREKLLKLVRALKERGAPIHGVGIQGHWEIDRVPIPEIEATIEAIQELGLKVMITELDIDVVPRSEWWADGGKRQKELERVNPYPDTCPPEVLERQADQYDALFRVFDAHADAIERVTFWNLHDGQSWLNAFPWTRTNHPLLFDRMLEPKPAFWSVVRARTTPPQRAAPGARTEAGGVRGQRPR